MARQGASIFLSNWAVLVVQLVTSVLVARTIGAELKGVLALLTGTVALIAMLGQLGLPAAAIYFARSDTYNVRTILASFSLVVVAVTVLACLLVALLRVSFITLFMAGAALSDAEIWLTIAALPAIMFYQFLASLLVGTGDAAAYRRLTIGFGLLNAGLTVLLVVVLRLGVVGTLWAALISYTFVVGLSLNRLLGSIAGETVAPGLAPLGVMLRFGLQQYAGTVGSQLFKRADIYLLALFLDTTAVGIYSVAQTAYEAVLSIPRAINALIAGEVAGGKGASSEQMVASTARNVLWLMSAVTLGLICVSPLAVPLFYGPAFQASVLPMIILLCAAVLVGLTSTLQAYFLGVGRPDLNGLYPMVSGGVNLILSLLLIPVAGAAGNALATLLAAFCLLALTMRSFRHLSGLPISVLWQIRQSDITGWRTALRSAVRRL